MCPTPWILHRLHVMRYITFFDWQFIFCLILNVLLLLILWKVLPWDLDRSAQYTHLPFPQGKQPLVFSFVSLWLVSLLFTLWSSSTLSLWSSKTYEDGAKISFTFFAPLLSESWRCLTRKLMVPLLVHQIQAVWQTFSGPYILMMY